MKCGGCGNRKNATPRWRCAAGTATGCAKRSAGIATTTGCTPGIRSRWPTTPPPAYISARTRRQRRGDHLRSMGNRRRHQPATAPPATPARHAPTVGSPAIRKSAPATSSSAATTTPPSTVAPGPDHRRGDRIDQVRNGNRWRVAWVDADGRPDRRRTAHRQRPRHLRGRLPPRARHPGLRHHPACRPRHDSGQRPPPAGSA